MPFLRGQRSTSYVGSACLNADKPVYAGAHLKAKTCILFGTNYSLRLRLRTMLPEAQFAYVENIIKTWEIGQGPDQIDQLMQWNGRVAFGNI